MIQLTRLNNARLAINSDLIKYVEEAPDTVITLVTGEKLVVRETSQQVIALVREFRRSIFPAGSYLSAGMTSAASPAARPVAESPAPEPSRG